MAPGRIDDLSKVAADVLHDDYQTRGYVLKTKQRTSFGGAVLSGQVDLFADDQCSTPAKLSWKVPAPFGFSQVNVDKLEMDRNGRFKFKASSNKVCPVFKMDVKSDLSDIDKVIIGGTYTGLKNLQIKMEHKLTQPLVFTGEMTYQCPAVTCGTGLKNFQIKMEHRLTKPVAFTGEMTYVCPAVNCGMKFSSATLSGGLPDIRLRFQRGQVFGSLLMRERCSAFVIHGLYDVNPAAKCAASYQYGGKGNGNFTLGLVYKGLYKVKVSQDKSICYSHRHTISKGLTLLTGIKYRLSKGGLSCGMQLSIE